VTVLKLYSWATDAEAARPSANPAQTQV